MFVAVSSKPRIGHLEALYHIFAYLKSHMDMGRLGYDPVCLKIDEVVFHHNAVWKDFYGDIEEELPARMPEPLGNPVTISAFVDANHAGNVVTRRSLVSLSLFRMHRSFGFPRGRIPWSRHHVAVSLWPCVFDRGRSCHCDTS